MKKLIVNMVFCLALIGVFSACTREVDDIFDRSAAQRLEDAMNEIEEILVSAPNGWEMHYYTQPETAGYIMLVRFDANGKVMVAAKNEVTTNRYKSDESTWEVIGDNGPVITFNSYNEVMHAFSDPKNDGVGMGGDYEFIVMEWTDNMLRLKGKKTEAYMDMVLVDANKDWEAHIDEGQKMNTRLFDSAVKLALRVDEKQYYTLSNATSHIFSVLPYGVTDVEMATPLSFVVTTKGISLYENFEVNGSKVRVFDLNPAATELVSREDPMVRITAPDVYDYFMGLSSEHLATSDNVFGTFLSQFSVLAQGFNERYSGRQDLQSIGFSKMRDGRLAFAIRTSSSLAMYALQMRLEDGKLVIDAFDADNMPATDMDNNAAVFYKNVPAVKEMLKLLPGTYMLENKVGLLINEIEMKSALDENNRLLMKR